MVSLPPVVVILYLWSGITATAMMLAIVALYLKDDARIQRETADRARQVAVLTTTCNGLKQLLEQYGHCRVEVDEIVDGGQLKIRIRLGPLAESVAQ